MGVLNWIRTQWDRAAALAALLIGAIAFLVGWVGVSGSAYVASQLPYIVSGALLGIFMVGIAAVLWLSADLRDEWRELRGIRQLLKDHNAAALAGSAIAAPAAAPAGAVGAYEAPAEQTSVIPAYHDGLAAPGSLPSSSY